MFIIIEYILFIFCMAFCVIGGICILYMIGQDIKDMFEEIYWEYKKKRRK